MAKDLMRLEDLRAERIGKGKRYLEFLRVASMSAGLYVLAAGEKDPQRPHEQDELYYVVRGRARFRLQDEQGAREHSVSTGAVLFVAARVVHEFFEITEELEVLVFFAPAETE
jgi:quercetin dioxygenase-like cupin family protein